MTDAGIGWELTRPAMLAALLILPLLYYYLRRTLVDLPRRQMLVSLGIRIAIVVLLVLSLAGLTLVEPTRNLFVVFAVDRSLSVAEDAAEKADEFIKEATQHAGSNLYSTLPFAAEPAQFVDEHATSKDEQPEELDDRGTNLAAAIEVAAAAIPPHCVPRIVLLTDGNQTQGDVLKTALGSDVEISTWPLQTRDDPEVQVSEVEVPAQVAQGEPFYVDVVIDSNHDDKATLEIFRGPHKIISEERDLKKGDNRFRFRQTIERERLAELTVRISPGEDTLLDNNSAKGLVFAAGKPRVLLIESHPELAKHIEWALEEEDVLVDVRPPQGMPGSLADLQNYEVLMISNVPATALTMRQMEVIRSYVQDLGGGLVMLGGDQSFGLGGYYKTVIEEILPVRSDFEKEKEKPSLAMILVLDKSGSMGGEKIELAKDAAKSAVELLGPRDQIGVIAFDGETYWVSELRSLAAKSLVLDQISTIEAGGGTTMYPAMDEAFNALRSATAKLKHVIILTDGHSSPGDFEGIAQEMAASRITVTTVGVGDGADQDLLERLASIGNGRYYFTNDPFSIPQIFAKETMTASKSAINEEPFVPQVVRPTQALSGIDFDTAPFLLGFVVTRPKATSEVVLATESGDPLLSWWRYGLGMSAAFTSDAKSRWAAEWLTWPGFNKFWAQVARHLMRKGEAKGFSVEIDRTGNAATVRLDSLDATGNFMNEAETELTLIDPRLDNQKISMQQTAPGRYVADIDLPHSGAYHLELAQKKDGQVIYRQSRGLVVGYPDELRLRPTNEDLLTSVAEATGGKYNPNPADVFAPSEATAARATPLWPILTAIALFLFVIDVALRRIDFSLLSLRPRAWAANRRAA